MKDESCKRLGESVIEDMQECPHEIIQVRADEQFVYHICIHCGEEAKESLEEYIKHEQWDERFEREFG